jgi:hypothetical protein
MVGAEGEVANVAPPGAFRYSLTKSGRRPQNDAGCAIAETTLQKRKANGLEWHHSFVAVAVTASSEIAKPALFCSRRSQSRG